MRAADRFEWATAADPSRNYCLWDYTPPRPPEDKYRSVNLLFLSFELAGLGPRAYAFVDAIRDAIGPFRTVFGVKWTGNELGWEFYFYDYERQSREISISRVLDALRPLAPSSVTPNESLPYFMFSLDLDPALVDGKRGIDLVHMYVGTAGSAVSAGIAYALRPESVVMENLYSFFDARTQLNEVSKKVSTSAFFDPTRMSVQQVVVPELRQCRTICVANKPTHDCIYFSEVTVEQLLWHLRQLRDAAAAIEFVAANHDKLDHLLFDVGIDYRADQGTLCLIKSGFYGVF